ncbi:NAD(P)-dependent dehydrogenase (short-subunit alcohol dehydrogenase family) [Novosphingobium chloroacetimidivorans]|uniref:NAD(P)-dependent dehydrogenase (Short-subunit alcohol dehydrogenase family) n=1 Tax=Novosphingobium chloroacetimidivorans TaxID=1428314 RepID=A0A7W7NW00_9SPHN|nr:SDR family oxidoreductase [Novosphingobium chloroacetimidivorans]MBB4857615.1 NAD(P)-dependent dehydrogenase (short-subunit alcohol dehydrogenase family) [Novosphingobium chloroacetimidivorans]
MDQKTAFITGSSQGIGAATARALAADGYRVIVHYGGNRVLAEEVARSIREAGGTAELVGGDLADPATPATLARQIAALCPEGLHALVLNAAVMPGNSDIAACTPDIFDQLTAVNLRAPFFLLQSLTPILAEGASVVFLSSLTARRVTGAVAAYGAMKAAIEHLVRRAAAELGDRWIRVNAVAPATTATGPIAAWTQTEQGRDMTIAVQALKRVAQPEDVGDAIAMLCSDRARWITGAVIPVDGGAML